MDKFTAAQARKMMPEQNGAEQLLEKVHNQIKNAAALGMYETEYKFDADVSYLIRRKVRNILREEGYVVSAPFACDFMFVCWAPR